MSTWISDEKGILHPAKERVSLKNLSGKVIEIEQTATDGKKFKQLIQPGMDYIYEGPDRAAMFQWWEENGKTTAEQMKERVDGSVTFGSDFRNNTEFLQHYSIARQAHGFKDMSEFLVFIGYDEKKSHAKFLERASVVNMHETPNRINELQRLGGGTDQANPGKNIRYGGFGDMPAV